MNTMKKTLTTNGNSWQLYINKPIAQMIGINENEYTVSFVIKNKILYIEKTGNITAHKNLYTKKLIKRSAGYGLNLPLPILELLEINPENDMVEINIDENKLIVEKC